MVGKNSKKIWYFILSSSFLWFLLVYFYYSGTKIDKTQLRNNFVGTHESKSVQVHENRIKEKKSDNPIENFFIGGDWDRYINEIISEESHNNNSINGSFGLDSKNNYEVEKKVDSEVVTNEEQEISNSDSDSDSCSGRYIYVHDLPSEYNQDLLKNCLSLSEWSNMCSSLSNFGLGPKLRNSDRIFSNSGWFETNQFTLEVIFHNRMKQYNCLTNDSSLASAIFVPYYAGLDVSRYLWNSHTSLKDYYSLNLVKWLREKPEWKRMDGRDHFLVAGRITWDFRRLSDSNSDWGNKLMLLPESRNMTLLTIEASPWHQNDFAIPYPTYFHPSSDNQLIQWQNRVRKIKRRFLFSFVGAPRPNMTDSIRGEIISQCQATRSRKCKLLQCASGSNKCYKPVNVMRIFQSSTFCLQPSGDSYTRRSAFDSILSGCIPVFFHPGSAYVQYLWHLPKDYTKYSVFIPANEVKNGSANIERILSRITKSKIASMREQVINLIPGIVYADPRSNLENLEDAFDITIEGVFERVDKIRSEIREGKNVNGFVGEEFSWKKRFFGTIGEHEWDHFFVKH
ncbi:probable xyloglucan galactosyltransferase GT11 [Mercurialis annua]|uniref:probable xyloglucan galactosyltransferase GT11 n=1 Tax=Mercurialis annua TaxID=3986 RepID=UPI00215DF311|nr:probable xyloglucan galactosyltransferase GT11 [Mercurialis annua]